MSLEWNNLNNTGPVTIHRSRGKYVDIIIGGYLRTALREGYLKLNFSIEKSDFLVRKCYSTDYNFLSFQYFFMKLALKERAWPLFFKTSKNIENGSVDKKFHAAEFKYPPPSERFSNNLLHNYHIVCTPIARYARKHCLQMPQPICLSGVMPHRSSSEKAKMRDFLSTQYVCSLVQ